MNLLVAPIPIKRGRKPSMRKVTESQAEFELVSIFKFNKKLYKCAKIDFKKWLGKLSPYLNDIFNFSYTVA